MVRGMVACLHPPEERQRVFEGQPEARPDRSFCGLCGAILFAPAPAAIERRLVIHLNGHRGEVNLLRGMLGVDPVLLNQGG